MASMKEEMQLEFDARLEEEVEKARVLLEVEHDLKVKEMQDRLHQEEGEGEGKGTGKAPAGAVGKTKGGKKKA